MFLILLVIFVGPGVHLHQRLSRHGQLHCHGCFDQGAHAAPGHVLAAVTNLIGAFFRHRRRGHHRVRPGGRAGGHHARVVLRADRGHRLEPADLVVRTAFQFVARAGGGLCGAVLAASGNRWSSIIWSIPGKEHWWQGKGILWKVIVPMMTSPLVGFVVGFIFMSLLYFLLRNWRPVTVNRVFGKLQLFSAGYMGFAHGTNDAQKTMGIIALALVAGTSAGYFDSLPGLALIFENCRSWYRPDPGHRDLDQVLCALTMCAGTAAGGWRIIKTLGQKMVKIHPVQGFAAETTGASVLFIAAHFGMPVSTTHAITTSIMGVGCAKGFNALSLGSSNASSGPGC